MYELLCRATLAALVAGVAAHAVIVGSYIATEARGKRAPRWFDIRLW